MKALFFCLILVFFLADSAKKFKLSNLQLSLQSTALPGSQIQVNLSAQISPTPNSKELDAITTKFKGEKSYWPQAELKKKELKCETTPCTLTFKDKLTSPKVEGLFVNMTWDLIYEKKVLASIGSSLDVTCSDGIYCNGIERLVSGKCKRSRVLPCASPKGDPCATFECFEKGKYCSQYPIGKNCALCKPSPCTPECGDRECGDDGCGGLCGECTDGKSCVGGSVCQIVTQDGSCVKPENLLGDTELVPSDGWMGTVYGDTSQSPDMVTPPCNSPGVPEYVYRIRVEENMGYEILMTAADGTTDALDTLLAIMGPNCGDLQLTAADRTCSDDASPPGGVGSRIDGILPPGEYTVIATAYSATNLAPFRLEVKFAPNCRPKCDGKYCGFDDCQSTCGTCDAGEICNSDFRCQTDPCIPDCEGRECSDDGCGGTCGECKDGLCELRTGICYPVTYCNSYVPVCPDDVSAQEQKDRNLWCGTDCQWHELDEPLPDLYPNNETEMISSIYFAWQTFENSSCAINEGCVTGSGDRLLMRFDTRVHNIGTGGYQGPPPQKNPQLFEWAPCHQHYHYRGFARFSIYDFNRKLLVPGAKLSYCMEDSEQYQFGSEIRCDARFDCLHQGIPRGRTDLYSSILDCQWLDITELKKKNCWFIYEVCTNWQRTILELSYDNNCQSFPVYIPEIPDDGQLRTYDEMVIQHNATSFFPGCKSD